MLKTKLYITGVTNLSDARYFAAMGADYLGFVASEYVDSTVINEMIDWVEGPQFIAELDGLEWNEDLIELIESLKINGLSYPSFWQDGFMNGKGVAFSKINVNSAINSDTDYFILHQDKSVHQLSKQEISELQVMCNSRLIYLDLPFEAKDIDSILETFKIEGLVLRGGNEVKVGLKSFDELDEIFDHLLM
jgi:phosphoribosylanthranilate isomerase